MIVLSTTIGPETVWFEPGARNSKRLPVKANGEVRLRSPGSLVRSGSVSTPMASVPRSFELVAPPLAIWSKTSASWSPRKIEMIAGGASLAPRRWSLLAEATDARSRPLWRSTPRMMAAQKTRNWALSCGLSPGTKRLPSSLLPSEKLTCLPEPLTPSKGFSWKRHSMPCFLATVLKVVISSCWWSEPWLARSNIGAISNWPGATSLWRVLAGMPSLKSSRSVSIMNAEHALGDGAEVVVVELLALGRLGAEEGAAGVDQVRARQEEVPVDQEVLLLRAEVGHDVLGVVVAEELQHALGVDRHRLLRAQDRRLVVERLAGHRDEDGRDAERVAVGVLEHVRRAHHVPAGVATGLERVAQAAVREAGRVRLALDQGLAGERRERRTVADRVEEAVVLLGGEAGQRVEDVRVVGRALLQRPVLHRRGDGVGDQRVQRSGLLDGGEHGLVDRLRQPLLHDAQAEDVGAEDLAGLLARVEADRRRDVGLHVRDGLQSDLVRAHTVPIPVRSPLATAVGANVVRQRIHTVSSRYQARTGCGGPEPGHDPVPDAASSLVWAPLWGRHAGPSSSRTTRSSATSSS